MPCWGRRPVRSAGLASSGLAAFLQQHAPDQADVLVGIEATGHYHVTLVEFLLERGYAVVLVNPYHAAQFRRSQGAKAKTDQIPPIQGNTASIDILEIDQDAHLLYVTDRTDGGINVFDVAMPAAACRSARLPSPRTSSRRQISGLMCRKTMRSW